MKQWILEQERSDRKMYRYDKGDGRWLESRYYYKEKKASSIRY